MAGSIDIIEGSHHDGARLLERALTLRPDHVDALSNYGLYLLKYARDAARAASCFERALRLSPGNVDLLFNLGTVELSQNRLEEASNHLRAVVEANPRHAGALNNLGAAAIRSGRRDLALFHYMKALELSPTDTDILSNLLNTAMAAGVLPLCLELFERLSRLSEPGVAVFPAYGFAKMRCLWDSTASLLPKLVERIENGLSTVSSFESVNLALLATPGISHTALFNLHKAAGLAIERENFESGATRHTPVPTRADRLRIGYLSPDFRAHAVNVFFRGIINHHDRDRFEVYCYSNTRNEDEITEQYRCAADAFVGVADYSNHELAERIRSDGIHILVELAGYTQDSRIRVLDLRPAPMQMIYLGYPYTSGLNNVDFVLCDPYLDGPENATFFVETPLRLPQSFITLDSLYERRIENVIPLDRNGFVTFGSMNNTYKLSPDLIHVWAKILQAVPRSRMIINHPNCDLEDTRRRIIDEFAACGIASDRVSIIWEKHPGGSHLRYYNDFDIVLDTFPLTGGTTTIDAVWMGVPVVTLTGAIYPERLSFSVLSSTGIEIDDLVAFSVEEYIAKAVALAVNEDRIRALHRMIPGAVDASILCDPVRFTRQMESTLVAAWNSKFPECVFNFNRNTDETEYVRTRSGAEIAVGRDPDDLTTYVLKEQLGCFDPEYDFVIDWLEEGMNVLDVGAGHGGWSLPLAKRAGNGQVLATTVTPGEAWYLQRGIDNMGLSNTRIAVKGDRLFRADREAVQQHWPCFDFVRLNLQPFQTSTLTDARRLLDTCSPLVMINVKRGKETIDTTLAKTLSDWGYGIYRLVPGLKLLAPHPVGEALDAFALNLFACKDDRAKALADRGTLIQVPEKPDSFPGIHDSDWLDHLAALDYSTDRLDDWTASMRSRNDWEVYWSALNLFARSRPTDVRPAQRLACLNTCLGLLRMLAQASPTLPRLISLARVLADAGHREEAAHLFKDIVGWMEQEMPGLDAEPFLAPSPYSETRDPCGRLHDWLFAGVLEQFERLRTFSSYFSGAEVIPMLEKLAATGFASDEMGRRLKLLRERSRPT